MIIFIDFDKKSIKKIIKNKKKLKKSQNAYKIAKLSI
jgi:hypothetical protein